jgi:hypothetical protein
VGTVAPAFLGGVERAVGFSEQFARLDRVARQDGDPDARGERSADAGYLGALDLGAELLADEHRAFAVGVGSRIRNSSPPKRAAKSLVRIVELMMRPTSARA